MPKRSAQDRIEFYRDKIRLLENDPKSRRRRIIYSSSDSSDCEEKCDTQDNTSQEHITSQMPKEVDSNPNPPELPVPGHSKASDAQENVPQSEPDVLVALGTKTGDVPEYGDKLHENLAQLWLPLLKKGMSKEDKEKTLKEYLIPQNCTLLQAPKLNPGISAAISVSARNRDKKITSIQQQLGTGITAVCRAIDLLISPNEDKLKTIKFLSDACRILSDLHHVETQARIKLITPCLDKHFLNVVQDTSRDDTLFGNTLSDKIKASKTFEKQGLQIKKSGTNPAPFTPAPRLPQHRGNWAWPPRYPLIKMTRGGPRKTSSYRKPNSTLATQTRPANKPQTRAQSAQQQQ